MWYPIGTGGGGGGVTIDDTKASQTTVYSSSKTEQTINQQLDEVRISNTFELPTEGTSGQRIYMIPEEQEYIFRGTYSNTYSIINSYVMEDNGNSITTSNGVVITVSSTLAGTSIAQAFDGDMNSGWKPDPSDTNPSVTFDFNGASPSPFPYVLAYKFNKGVGSKLKEIRKYNLPNVENEANSIVTTIKEDRIVDADVYHAKSNMSGGFCYHKITFNTSDINLKSLELVTGLWVPVY